MAERNFQNRTLFKGDNLLFLQGMNSGTVDLIATDPPFNKGKDFHATPESLAAGARFQDRWSWRRDVQQTWVDAIKDDKPSLAALIEYVKGEREDLAAFLCFMGIRLIEMHRVLKDTGSLYLHCDPTASHYLKALCDAIFGDKHFRNEIVWGRSGGRTFGNHWGNTHDIILYYTKSDKRVWRDTFIPSDNDKPTSVSLTGQGTRNGESGKPWMGFNPTAFGRHWSAPRTGNFALWIEANLIPNYTRIDGIHKRLDALSTAGLVKWSSGGTPTLTRPAEADAGVKMNDIWVDVHHITGSRERVGYPTQKPLALYERIIKASSNPGDIVLDPFCGCATTPIAAERLGRQWVGMDLWDGAYDIVQRRMEDNKQLLTDDNPQIILRGEDDIPARTDGEDETPPVFDTPISRATEKWQRLSHAEMRDILYDAQNGVCAGCGRELEKEFMELDHIMPRADGGSNDITNRIMLCSPCNRKKSHTLTLSGLVRENKKSGWMKSESRAKQASSAARLKADMIKNAGA